MANLYKTLIVFGGLLMAAGIALFLLHRFNMPVGRLPGDIVISKGKFTLYFPIATSILVSAALSLIFYLLNRR